MLCEELESKLFVTISTILAARFWAVELAYDVAFTGNRRPTLPTVTLCQVHLQVRSVVEHFRALWTRVVVEDFRQLRRLRVNLLNGGDAQVVYI